ncbi:MAG: carboxypeptidase regulatory-like domain-containing protein [Candidatus Kerfeldbacteria bacterium]|nr:carboxypeptidase regulatory-like domain-containing protein [Candidatus Kerfeldbacteria bacterium]
MIKKQQNKSAGNTLLETIIAIAIFALVTSALYTLIQLGIRVLRDDSARLDAVSIAQAQLETIKNLPYEDIGVVGGIPEGAIEQTTTTIRNNNTFTVETDIRYIDDAFDDVAPTDTVNTDYKKIRVEVRWNKQVVQKPVILITNIAPEGVETDTGGGTMWVEVYNANAEPIPNATVQVVNTEVDPAISFTSATDSNGQFLLPGADPSVQAYQITISKTGYSSAQTYGVDAETNPHPDPAHLTVVESEVTTATFTIDAVSDLSLHVEDYISHQANTNASIRTTGNKRIGTDLDGNNISKFDRTNTTNGTGDIVYSDIEFDTYTATLSDGTYDFAGSTPHLPYVLPPDSTVTMTILTAPDASDTLLLTIEDSNTIPLAGATAHLWNADGSIDLTQTTNDSGQTFFTPLISGTFTIDVSADGFMSFSDSIDISGDATLLITLTP